MRPIKEKLIILIVSMVILAGFILGYTQIIRQELIILTIGIMMIIFRRPLSHSALKSQMETANRKHMAPEVSKATEQMGPKILEIGTIVVGSVFVIGSLLALFGIIKVRGK